MVLRRLDHAGIWFLIIGSFTPIHIILLRGFWRYGVLSLIWVIGICGLVLEVIYLKEIPQILVLSFYLGLGWVGVVSALKCHQIKITQKLYLLLYGGLSYSLGGLVDYLNE
jgi:hemolysin III